MRVSFPTCVHFTPNTQTCLLLVLVTVLLQAQHRSDYLCPCTNTHSTRIHVQICPVQYMLCLLEVLESQHFTARSIEGQTRFLVRTARHKVYRVLYRRHRAQEDPPIGRIHQRYCYTCVTKIAWY